LIRDLQNKLRSTVTGNQVGATYLGLPPDCRVFGENISMLASASM
jgi:hypothetical protein